MHGTAFTAFKNWFTSLDSSAGLVVCDSESGSAGCHRPGADFLLSNAPCKCMFHPVSGGGGSSSEGATPGAAKDDAEIAARCESARPSPAAAASAGSRAPSRAARSQKKSNAAPSAGFADLERALGALAAQLTGEEALDDVFRTFLGGGGDSESEATDEDDTEVGAEEAAAAAAESSTPRKRSGPSPAAGGRCASTSCREETPRGPGPTAFFDLALADAEAGSFDGLAAAATWLRKGLNLVLWLWPIDRHDFRSIVIYNAISACSRAFELLAANPGAAAVERCACAGRLGRLAAQALAWVAALQALVESGAALRGGGVAAGARAGLACECFKLMLRLFTHRATAAVFPRALRRGCDCPGCARGRALRRRYAEALAARQGPRPGRPSPAVPLEALVPYGACVLSVMWAYGPEVLAQLRPVVYAWGHHRWRSGRLRTVNFAALVFLMDGLLVLSAQLRLRALPPPAEAAALRRRLRAAATRALLQAPIFDALARRPLEALADAARAAVPGTLAIGDAFLASSQFTWFTTTLFDE